MATVLEVITDAIVELGARSLGDPPGPEEAALGLSKLQALFTEAVDAGVFGRLTEYIATDDYTAEENQRVISGGFTITLPTSITDEFEGTARPPHDLSMIQVVNTGSDPEISIWDASLNAWVRLDGLALTDTCPLSGRVSYGLACILAARLASAFQKPLPQTSAAHAAGLRSILSNRASAPRNPLSADYF